MVFSSVSYESLKFWPICRSKTSKSPKFEDFIVFSFNFGGCFYFKISNCKKLKGRIHKMINVESANCPLLGPLDVHLITELSLEEEKQNNLEEANDEIDPHVGVEPSCAKLVWPQVPEEHHAANDQPGKAEEQPDEEVDRRDQQDGGATGWDQVPQQWQDVQQQVGVPAHLQPRSEWE